MHKSSIGIGLGCVVAVLALQPGTGRAGGTSPAPRFDATGSVLPLERSNDGRFAGGGEARFVPEANSADVRFALKSTNAPSGGCAPFPDFIFASGFES